jgi:hypothetical protein
MYDMKTATRLYVLEGRHSQPAACSFSPDGRRLVSVFLEQNVVLAWKVGSSIASLFNPGAPPRQGRAGSEPFKTLKFNVGDQGEVLNLFFLFLLPEDGAFSQILRIYPFKQGSTMSALSGRANEALNSKFTTTCSVLAHEKGDK